MKKPKEFDDEYFYVGPSKTREGKYFWCVYAMIFAPNGGGWTDTFDHAMRAARNLMKNNQNLVYGGEQANG